MTAFVDPNLQRYVTTNSLEKRQAISQRLLSTYPDRVPILIGRAELMRTPEVSCHKYMAPRNITFAKFLSDIRVNIPDIDSTVALFFFVGNGVLPVASLLMETIYDKHKSSDGFLYVIYTAENTFG